MPETQRARQIPGNPVPPSALVPTSVTQVNATDATELSQQLGEWSFELTQLKRGAFKADGVVLGLDGVSIARISMSQTLLQRGCAPRGMVAVFTPGAGSGPAFAHGQLVGSGQCVTLAGGQSLEAVTHAPYLDIGFALDLEECRDQLDSLNGGPIELAPGMSIAAPGPTWVGGLMNRVDWLLAAVAEYPDCLNNDQVRASLKDRVLAAMVRFDSTPVHVDSSTRAARASRRIAVQLACDFIHSSLSEPLRLSELCRHANLKIRALEYGFREVTGLTPVAYVRSLRLNAARRALQQGGVKESRSISEIALDTGFWHLSQFAMDYRRFFGETPTETRRRSLAKGHRPSVASN